MPSPVIFTSLILAATSAWLVFQNQWEAWTAFAVVAGTTLLIVAALMAALMLVVGKNSRAELWKIFTTTIKHDLTAIAHYFSWKKR